MKVIVQDTWHSADVLALRDIPEPVPMDREVVVRACKAFPLSEAPDASRYIEAGRARGKILLTV